MNIEDRMNYIFWQNLLDGSAISTYEMNLENKIKITRNLTVRK